MESIYLNIEGVKSEVIGNQHGLSGGELSSVDQNLEKAQKEIEDKLQTQKLLKESMMGWLSLGKDKLKDVSKIQAYADEIAKDYR